MFVKNFAKIKLFKDTFNTKKYNFQTIKLIVSMEKKPRKLKKLLNQVKWKVYDGIPCRIHGDLQFDNIYLKMINNLN